MSHTIYSRKGNSVFTQVDYRQFRQFLSLLPDGKVKGKGFETALYDRSGDIQAIVHAASIDELGNCHPAAYFVKTSALSIRLPQAA